MKAFDPLLVQLCQSGAPEGHIISEGYSPYELRAVRTLLKRAGTTTPSGPVGERTSRHAVTAAGGTTPAH